MTTYRPRAHVLRISCRQRMILSWVHVSHCQRSRIAMMSTKYRLGWCNAVHYHHVIIFRFWEFSLWLRSRSVWGKVLHRPQTICRIERKFAEASDFKANSRKRKEVSIYHVAANIYFPSRSTRSMRLSKPPTWLPWRRLRCCSNLGVQLRQMGDRGEEQTSWNNRFLKQRSRRSRDLQTTFHQKCCYSVFQVSNGDGYGVHDTRPTKTSCCSTASNRTTPFKGHCYTVSVISTVGFGKPDLKNHFEESIFRLYWKPGHQKQNKKKISWQPANNMKPFFLALSHKGASRSLFAGIRKIIAESYLTKERTWNDV